jgi:mRNA interferase RelE/StbE
MADYRIEFVKSSQKEFEKLPKNIQTKTLDALHVLARNPYSDLLRVKRLKGAQALYRIRIGDYRIVYDIRADILVILVIKIGHRSDVYRRLS